MRIIIGVLFFIAQNIAIFAQGSIQEVENGKDIVVPDARLETAYGAEHTAQLMATNPQVIEKLNFYMDNGWMITDFPPEKGDISALPTVQLESLENINILLLEKQQKLTKDLKKWSFYRINDSQKVLVLFSTDEFNRRYSRWKKRKE